MHLRVDTQSRALRSEGVAMRLSVDPQKCTGCGACEDLAADLFRMEGDLPVVLVEPVPAPMHEAADIVVETCPVEAISLARD